MLSELEKRYGVSGLEAPVREFLKENLQGYCHSLTEDGMGNLIAKKQGRNHQRKVLLAVHMDEPGIIVTKITEDGYLKFDTVGRIRPEFLVSKRVSINGISGVIALKAVHLASKAERETPVTAGDLFVDMGADSMEEASRFVTPGDYGVIESEFVPFGDSMVKGRAIGGRMGCAIGVELLKEACPVDLEVVFSAQREVGCRGMVTALRQSEADFAIVLDGIAQEAVECGRGVVLPERLGAVMPDADLCRFVAEVADKAQLSLQRCVAEEKGQESVLAKAPNVKRWICLGIPVRYPESAAQVASLKDMDALQRLLKLCLKELEKEGNCI